MGIDVSRRLPLVPASFFGIVLGTVGLGDCWRASHEAWGTSTVISDTIMTVAVVVWIALVVLFAAKWILRTDVALAEFHHPVQSCSIGLVAVTTLLMAYLADGWSRPLALVLFAVGAIGQLLYGCYFTANRLKGGQDALTISAAIYLPTVAGNFVSAFAAAYIGLHALAVLFFGAGVLSWLMIESQVGFRMAFSPRAAGPMLPAMGILLAPPVVGCEAYLFIDQGRPGTFALALVGCEAYLFIDQGRPGTFALALVGYGLFLFFVLAWSLPAVVAAQPFSAAYWAYSFGVTSLAFDLILMHARGLGGFFDWISIVGLVVANAAVAILAVGTLVLLGKGKLIPKPALANQPASPAVR